MYAIKKNTLSGLVASLLFTTSSLTLAVDADFSGQVRTLLSASSSNAASPLRSAYQLAPGLSNSDGQSTIMETELHGSVKGITAVATLQGQANGASSHTQATAWLNELYGGVGDGAWQLSAGKKTISWDVGYGFRPNDVVAQEARRSLISTTVIGKPLVSLDYFNASSSLSLVWVNPGRPSTSAVADEQAFAARLYHHLGSVDLHGFARYGQKDGSSLGTALSWVASDEMEIHASLRYLRHNASLSMTGNPALIQRVTPWQTSMQDNAVQAMVGANYTTESQHSFFLEAWWDGTALPDQAWRDWNNRNQSLLSSANFLPQYQREIGYNLAWQNQALSAAGNIRRKNLFARWSWQESSWQPSLDVLWTPEDGGRVVTAALSWQGNRLAINGGLRFYGGPGKAILAQLPDNRTAYVSAAWAF